MENKQYKARLNELKKIYSKLPKYKLTVLSSTIETVAFMDCQLKDLEAIIATGNASTPDKQLYSSMAKTRDSLVKRLMADLPQEEEEDDLSEFLNE